METRGASDVINQYVFDRAQQAIQGAATMYGVGVETRLMGAATASTDAIIPKQFLQKVTRTGFGAHLFNDWRFLDEKGQQPNPDFVLNFPQYQGASILLARENFGCGSSREHAPWALTDYGFKVVIAPSFADIFYGNSFNNQLLPVKLSDAEVDELFALVKANPGIHFDVDAVGTAADRFQFRFNIAVTHRLLGDIENMRMLNHFLALIRAELGMKAEIKQAELQLTQNKQRRLVVLRRQHFIQQLFRQRFAGFIVTRDKRQRLRLPAPVFLSALHAAPASEWHTLLPRQDHELSMGQSQPTGDHHYLSGSYGSLRLSR